MYVLVSELFSLDSSSLRRVEQDGVGRGGVGLGGRGRVGGWGGVG